MRYEQATQSVQALVSSVHEIYLWMHKMTKHIANIIQSPIYQTYPSRHRRQIRNEIYLRTHLDVNGIKNPTFNDGHLGKSDSIIAKEKMPIKFRLISIGWFVSICVCGNMLKPWECHSKSINIYYFLLF